MTLPVILNTMIMLQR